MLTLHAEEVICKASLPYILLAALAKTTPKIHQKFDVPTRAAPGKCRRESAFLEATITFDKKPT